MGVINQLVRAENQRNGTLRPDVLTDRQGSEQLVETRSRGVVYWRSHLALGTSPEAGLIRRLKRMPQLPGKLGRVSLERAILAMARDVPRDCEKITHEVAARLGANNTRFELWEPKEIRRRIHATYGIACPALNVEHLEQLLAMLRDTPDGEAAWRAGADAADTPLGTLYVSYATEDRAFVDKLVTGLNTSVRRLWYERHEILVSDSVIAKINGGITAADYVILVLSPASTRTSWVVAAITAIATRRLADGEVRLLPIVKEQCDLPPLLQNLRYADFRESFCSGLNELRLALQGIAGINVISAR